MVNGDMIVIVIIDSGFDFLYEDIIGNIWINLYEIFGDGIDNDNNGYVDDINGWDFCGNGFDIVYDDYGLCVFGILVVMVNNDKGIVGVCWNLKIMYLSIGFVVGIVLAYEYVFE